MFFFIPEKKSDKKNLMNRDKKYREEGRGERKSNKSRHLKQELANKQVTKKLKLSDYIVGMGEGNMRL